MPQNNRQLRAIASLGLNMAIMVGGFCYTGYYFDLKMENETPYLTIIGVIFSLVGMFYQLFRFIKK